MSAIMMSCLNNKFASLVLVIAAWFCNAAYGQFLAPLGVPQLQALATNVNGTGIRIGQPEAALDGAADTVWEVDPTNAPANPGIFTFIYSNTIMSTSYPNGLGTDSWHADLVAGNIYGMGRGIATNVSHVDNYDANNFVEENNQDQFYFPYLNTNDRVMNQSWIFTDVSSNDEVAIDQLFDNYAAKYGILFVGGAGNSDGMPISPPATCYNGIGVGVYNGGSSPGPTVDGRCQPLLTASATNGDTSFSTGYVTGAAAALMQAALRGDGGGDTNSAVNTITIKTLLLNGAVKPAGWANIPPSPLDYTYGAGYLNVFNSYEQLAGGKHSYNFATNIPTGTVHPPVTMALSAPVLNGWDFNTNTSSAAGDGVNHYFFNVTNGARGAAFSLTATLVWNKHYNATTINNLELFLYNTANSNLVAASTSAVDNLQQVFVPQLAQGRYDLQVWKAGGSYVTASEPYGLAWEMYSEFLTMKQQGTNLCLSWPAYPAGFQVETATSLNPPVVWSANNVPSPIYTNNQSVMGISPGSSAEYFRLQEPDF
jgi:Subtilase family